MRQPSENDDSRTFIIAWVVLENSSYIVSSCWKRHSLIIFLSNIRSIHVLSRSVMWGRCKWRPDSLKFVFASIFLNFSTIASSNSDRFFIAATSRKPIVRSNPNRNNITCYWLDFSAQKERSMDETAPRRTVHVSPFTAMMVIIILRWGKRCHRSFDRDSKDFHSHKGEYSRSCWIHQIPSSQGCVENTEYATVDSRTRSWTRNMLLTRMIVHLCTNLGVQ